MRLSKFAFFCIATAVWAVLASVVPADADTFSLELKHRDQQRRTSARDDYLLWASSPQRFFVQLVAQKEGPLTLQGGEALTAAFQKIVKKEPKYECDIPFRGVIKLGSSEFAFALDAVQPKPKAESKKSAADGKDSKSDKKDKNDAANKSAKSPAERWATVSRYNRLYFDFNNNGDLTDDKVVDSAKKQPVFNSSNYSSLDFPRIEAAIDVEGTKIDVFFTVEGYSMLQGEYGVVMLSFSPATRREGEISLDGKKHRLVLLDFNGNGRFDDEISIDKNIRGQHNELYPQQGDMLLIDPKTGGDGHDSPYDVTAGDYRHFVSKTIVVDGRLYDLKISPAGDKITFTPSDAPMGSVTNPNGRFRALIYGDKGFLKIAGNKDEPIPVPAGEWKLFSYTIDLTESARPDKPGEKKPAVDENKKKSLAESLMNTIELFLGVGDSSPARRAPAYTLVSAQATGEYKPVKVVKGETIAFPFGPPYKPLVDVGFVQDNKTLYLQMRLVGSTDEICEDMYVRGGRPSKPRFTITDSKGEVVQQGDFEYG